MTICGAGAQSRTQLEASLIERPAIEKVYIYDIIRERADQFAEEMKARFGIQVIPLDEEGLPEAVKESDIITTVTLASQPIVKGGMD